MKDLDMRKCHHADLFKTVVEGMKRENMFAGSDKFATSGKLLLSCTLMIKHVMVHQYMSGKLKLREY